MKILHTNTALTGKYRIRVGDAVAAVAQPVAKAADAVLGTDLQNCPGCKKRQRTLNNAGEVIAGKVQSWLG